MREVSISISKWAIYNKAIILTSPIMRVIIEFSALFLNALNLDQLRLAMVLPEEWDAHPCKDYLALVLAVLLGN